MKLAVARALRAGDDITAAVLLEATRQRLATTNEPHDAEDDLPDVCACGRLLGPADPWVHCVRCAS
jgi:hypothetical protein